MPHHEGDSVAAGPVCIGGVYVLRDEWSGKVYEIPVAVGLAEAIRKLDEGLAQRERRHRQRVVSFTAAEVDGDLIAAGKPARDHAPKEPRYAGRPWEGPGFTFTLLVGIGTLWPGPPRDGEPCACCAGLDLEPYACCLSCCRTGRDAEIRKATPRELAALRERVPRRDGMPGGRGKATPAKAAARAKA